MTKRSMRSKSRESYSSQENVHPLFPGRGWSPHNTDGDYRDRKYVKNVKAQSEAQQQFMDAIDAHSVVLALGPAGTGKTYLAIAKAVEAL
jgi:phosphate starvation-inducible protein PhoH and related proteins